MTEKEKPSKSEVSEREEKILEFWNKNQIFKKTLEKDSPNGEFVFYDGPPFATGLPHAGSLLSSVTKDVIPRYKTMRGYYVRRRWGWDCHGLPIENMIEKELGIRDKKEIEEKIGVKAFNEACRSSVLRYAKDWKNYIDRVGRWVEYDNAYKTMDNSYIESVWYALKTINEKGYLYEGRKVLLYCPHCETPIAKAEVAMDNSYKDVTEESVTVEFRVKGKKNTFILAWTTTPWTLPGNVALAVRSQTDYVEIEKKDMGVGEMVRFILAKDRLEANFGKDEYKILREMKGKDLVGLEYEPLFETTAMREVGKRGWYVAEADFVNTEEGTGIVHTAVLYGEDDYALGLKLNLPMVQMLDSAGHFNDRAPELIKGQYFKKAEKAIKEDLEKRGLLFMRNNHTHSYPHCHRCGTALLYNAISSWFINIQKVKNRMIELNEKINWVPEHLKHGRFLNIVENAPDWTISRNRYWASPLPIWKDADGKVCVIGSLDELKKLTKKSGNKYLLMRHGESEHNVLDICDSNPNSPYHLTEIGKRQIETSSGDLKNKNISLIYCSPFLRSKETARLVCDSIGFPYEKVIFDDRIGEYHFGEFDSKPFDRYVAYRDSHLDDMNLKMPGGESFQNSKNRFGGFFQELESKYSTENVLIITHGIAFEVLPTIISGLDSITSRQFIRSKFKTTKNATFEEFDFIPLPHNENYELDLHRPYIDDITLTGENGVLMKRIPEVIDGWVESASMPFAEYHYPFENKKVFQSHFPGDFVAEYIAQTRTWFYYMHAMASILFDSVAFRNVVSTGNILAGDGSKMSKSKGNYTDPLLLLDWVGADAFRYYLMSSVVMQSEDMLFKDEEVKEVHNRFINILWNSFAFYELYADDTPAGNRSRHVLDKWILYRLDTTIFEVTEAMESYDMARASRPLKEFVTDLSTWYVRRSRNRFKGNDAPDKAHALATARYIFKEFSKLIAPITPFIAEEIYLKVKEKTDCESVHLATWPKVRKSFFSFLTLPNDSVPKEMSEARRIVNLALEARSKVNIKVRQPLHELRIKKELGAEYLDIIKDEINVKSVIIDESISEEIKLDITLSEKLLEEGKVREVIRSVQEWRKEKNLKPGETARYSMPESDKELFSRHSEEIEKATNVELVK